MKYNGFKYKKSDEPFAMLNGKLNSLIIGELIKKGEKLNYPRTNQIKIKQIMEQKKQTKEQMEKSKTELLEQLNQKNIFSMVNLVVNIQQLVVRKYIKNIQIIKHRFIV